MSPPRTLTRHGVGLSRGIISWPTAMMPRTARHLSTSTVAGQLAHCCAPPIPATSRLLPSHSGDLYPLAPPAARGGGEARETPLPLRKIGCGGGYFWYTQPAGRRTALHCSFLFLGMKFILYRLAAVF